MKLSKIKLILDKTKLDVPVNLVTEKQAQEYARSRVWNQAIRKAWENIQEQYDE